MRLAKDDKEDLNQDYQKGIEATARGFYREGETGLNSKQAGGDTVKEQGEVGQWMENS